MRGIRYYKLRVHPRLYSTPEPLNVDTVLEESERNYPEKKEIILIQHVRLPLKGKKWTYLENQILFANRSGILAQGSQGLPKLPSAFSCVIKSVVFGPGATTWTVSECNSFEIAFGLPWDCFDLERITSPISKSGALAPRHSGLLFRSRRTYSAKSRFQTPFTQRQSLIFSLVSLSVAVLFFARIREWWGEKEKPIVTERGSKWFDLSRYDWHCFHTRNRPYIFAEDATRFNDKINENVNINSFSLPLQWAEIRRCLYSGLLTDDISKCYEKVVSASVFEKFNSTRNIFYNAIVYIFT